MERSAGLSLPHVIVEKSNRKNLFRLDALGHFEVAEAVAQQQHVRPTLHLSRDTVVITR